MNITCKPTIWLLVLFSINAYEHKETCTRIFLSTMFKMAKKKMQTTKISSKNKRTIFYGIFLQYNAAAVKINFSHKQHWYISEK